MTDALIVAAGFLLIVAGLLATVGVWVLIPAGTVLVLVGLFTPFDRLRGPNA